MSRFAILCSGQGAQTPELFQLFPFTKTGEALRQRILGAKVLEPEVAGWLSRPETNPRAVYQNRFSQPLLCLYQAMIWEELAALVPPPALIAGYSLGELSAYGCAGAIAPEDVVRLAAVRARWMDAAGPAGELIAVTGLPAAAAAKPEGAHLAIVIGDDHCVIGCLAGRAPSLAEELRAAGARDAVLLAVTVASHTPILDAAVEPFRSALRNIPWHPPQTPVLAGVSAAKILRREHMEQLLPEQIHRTIRWDLVQQRLQDSGCRVLLELGPGCQLARMAAARGLEARGVTEFRSPQGIADWLQAAIARSE